MTTKNLMKRVMPLALAFLMILSAVLVPVNAKAETKPSALASYMMEVGEEWYAPVYYLDDDASVTYKIAKKKVATVDKEGLVTANKKGKCKLVVTVKQGGKTYKTKTTITVKKELTTYEYACRFYGEFAMTYQLCFDAAYANGWVYDDGTYADETYGEWLKTYYRVVMGIQDIMDNSDNYTDEEIVTVLKYGVELLEGAGEALDVFSSTPN